jgi:hypothetical protein
MEKTDHLRRKLRPFRDFAGPLRRNRHARNLRLESVNQPDEVSDLQYCVTGLPKDMTRSDKIACLSELADTITNIGNSDIFVISMWIGVQ